MIYTVIIFILLIIDQIIKYVVIKGISEGGIVTIINGLLDFVYVKNYGIAFGLFQNKVIFFAILTSLVAIVLGYAIYYYKSRNVRVAMCLAVILGGALGNIIDRIRLGYVIDYISVSFFSPIFNFADSCVVMGAIVLCLLVLTDKTILEEEKK